MKFSTDTNARISEICKTSTSPTIKLSGDFDCTIKDVIDSARSDANITLKPSKSTKDRLTRTHQEMMSQVKNGVPIYGTTSAYGAQAKNTLNTKATESQNIKEATKLSEAIIHVDVSTGPILPRSWIRSALLIRSNMLLPGYSAIRLENIQAIVDLLNHDLVPAVGSFGTVGASGDLAQNGRVLSTLLHHPTVKIIKNDNRLTNAKSILKKHNLKPISLLPKEGLALVNGDNFSTAAASHIIADTLKLLTLSHHISAINIQALKGSNRNFHPLLSHIKNHPGQDYSSSLLRRLLDGSQLSPQELKTIKVRSKGEMVQDPYSIRTLPQYFGPSWETINHLWSTITTNINSVSDNPLWTTPETTTQGEQPYQWVSGGNFLAMHMSDAIDKLRKILVHIVKASDRHLNRMINPKLSNGLPANLSDNAAISRCTFKGLQTQMGMYEVYAQILASPVSTSFGIHEELNQDLTSHALTSALMTKEVMRLTKLALATNLIAGCQAIDLLGGPQLLAKSSQPLYEWTRENVPYIKVEQPLGHHVEIIASKLLNDQKVLSILLAHADVQ